MNYFQIFSKMSRNAILTKKYEDEISLDLLTAMFAKIQNLIIGWDFMY